MSILEVPLVAKYRQVAGAATRSEASQSLDQVRSIRADSKEDAPAHSSAVETAFRDVFVELIASLDIENDDYSPVWSLLDAINLLCDNELCDFALGFWLIEDLLDSQTIRGCREVFAYLESRRERMTKVNFKQKHLTILRCCNELLRRLSRAEDTVFCGRVFIYLFQSFPLGDKSSVNLRGEFHVENTTSYDEIKPIIEQAGGSMDLDTDKKPTAQPTGSDTQTDLNKLYPIFWSLQTLFSSPTKLFEPAAMQQFKHAIGETMTCFSTVNSNAAPTTTTHDSGRRGTKRKRSELNGDNSEASSSAFNPKYLTNRDLFDLEIHDIEFRRHVLVQSLILLDFLVSFSAQGQAKLSTITLSKSIGSALYDKYTLSEEDRLWASETRRTVERYLEEGSGTEGRYYLRMVNMVLSRDRNWAFWKAEGCPPISRDAVQPKTVKESEEALEKVSKVANARQRIPPEASRLAFLSSTESAETLKARRPPVPTLQEYYESIQREDLDLDFANTPAEKQEIEDRKAGKLWRALRSARGKRFRLCEEIKNGDELGALIGKVKATKSDDHEAGEQESAQKLLHEPADEQHKDNVLQQPEQTVIEEASVVDAEPMVPE